MAASRSKSHRAAPSSGSTTINGQNVEDRKLLQFVRANGGPIVAALTRAAAVSGDGRDWQGMSDYLQIASQFSTLCEIAPQPAMKTMTAGA